MKAISLKYLVVLVCYFILFQEAKGQVCTDSIALYHGLSFPPASIPWHTNKSLNLKNGNNCRIYSNQYYPDPIICLTDRKGQLLKSGTLKTAGGNRIYSLKYVEAADDGIYLLAAILKEEEISYSKAVMLIKLDSALNLEWSQEYKNKDAQHGFFTYYLNDINTDKAGNIFFSFYFSQINNQYPETLFFIAADSTGRLLWDKALDCRNVWPPATTSFSFSYLTPVDLGGKALFIGGYVYDTIISGKRIHQYGYIGFSFDKATGNFSGSKLAYIPEIIETLNWAPGGGWGGPSSINTFTDQAKGMFYWGFSQTLHLGGGISFSHLVTLWIDSTFNFYKPRRIKGSISGFSFSVDQNCNVAFQSQYYDMDAYAIFPVTAVVDTANRVLFSKEVGRDFFQFPWTGAGVQFSDNGNNIRIDISDLSPPHGTTQLNIPLHSRPPDSLLCLGKDTIPFTFDTVALVKRDISPGEIYQNVVDISPAGLLITPFPLQEEHYCTVKSVCDSISLAGNTSFCAGTPQTFVAKRNSGCYKEITWNTDSLPGTVLSKTDTSITFLFNREWNGYLKTNLYGCTVADSVVIEVHPNPLPVALGRDTVFCPVQPMVLNAGTGYMAYLWQDGSKDSVLTVSRPGKYHVTATDHCGNKYSDTISVLGDDKMLYAGKDTLVCKTEMVQLTASSGFTDYKWSTGFYSDTLAGISIAVSPDKTTLYTVTANKFQGCVMQDSVIIAVKDCPEYFYMPTAFTPNNDGRNDLIKPAISGIIREYEFCVYNRWGNLVFRSTDPNSAWDGNIKGQKQGNDIFAWVCRYRYADKPAQVKKGTFALLR